MELASNALTTAAAVKSNLNGCLIDINDDLINQKINEVSQFIETYTGRKFNNEIREEKLAGTGSDTLPLRHYPAGEVLSVLVEGNEIDIRELDTENNNEAGTAVLFRELGWPASDRRNILVKYESGYILPRDQSEERPRTLPYDLEGACIDLTTMKYLNRDAEGLAERRSGDFAEKYLNDIPASIKLILDLYKKRG
ncbi:hypothetical protein [Ruminiclostridium cellobioparum]|jgi:hypothetical protein|uniref:hypothetical protein n=1 Tax=Ruminiclostridium cellobioparum TaxID=29355 RepID=UPI0028A8F1DA|nr:hypothetical protein [Ruminiclostridium cellobioparum]